MNYNCFNEPFAVSFINLILRHAWLNLFNKHLTTGRINQEYLKLTCILCKLTRNYAQALGCEVSIECNEDCWDQRLLPFGGSNVRWIRTCSLKQVVKSTASLRPWLLPSRSCSVPEWSRRSFLELEQNGEVVSNRNQATSVLTATTLLYAFGAGITKSPKPRLRH